MRATLSRLFGVKELGLAVLLLNGWGAIHGSVSAALAFLAFAGWFLWTAQAKA